MLTEMMNAFDGLISRLDTAEDRISELEDLSMEASKPEKLRGQRLKKQNRMSKECGTTIKDVTYV